MYPAHMFLLYCLLPLICISFHSGSKISVWPQIYLVCFIGAVIALLSECNSFVSSSHLLIQSLSIKSFYTINNHLLQFILSATPLASVHMLSAFLFVSEMHPHLQLNKY